MLDSHAPLGREYLGKARAMLRRLAVAEANVEREMHRALAPLSRRLARHPVLRSDDLIDARRRWCAIDPTARLCPSSVNISDPRKPEFHDLRAWCSKYRGLDWDAEAGAEDGIAVMSVYAFASHTSMVLHCMPVVVVGLHCLGRRFQRSPTSFATEATVLAEIGELAIRGPDGMEGGEFAFPVPGGEWRGHVIESKDNQTVVVARTYIDADQMTTLAA
jgi:hypothetical protein